MKRISPVLVCGIATTVAASVALVMGINSYNGAPARLNRSMNAANHYLSELNYEQSEAAYRDALEIDPRNTDAWEGIMQVAKATDNEELFAEAYTSWNHLISDGAVTDDQSEIQDTIEAIEYHQEQERLVEKVVSREYRLALENITDEQMEDEDIAILKRRLLLRLADEAWQQRNYETALDYLLEALKLDPASADILDKLLMIYKAYVAYCINKQKKEKAKELMDSAKDVFGKDVLSEYRDSLEHMEEIDESLQGIIEELNRAFEADDVDQITEIMQSDEFKEQVKKLHNVLYSKNLASQKIPEGKGTAIYPVNYTAYVYYGNYHNGKREGKGLWYFSIGEGKLTKYDLEWVNDLPNGAGKVDTYSTLRIHSPGGVVTGEYKTHETADFVTNDGVIIGDYKQHSDIIGEAGRSYDMTFHLEDGYSIRIEPGEYPAEIEDYVGYAPVLSAWAQVPYYDEWWGEYNDYFYWNYWTPSRWGIEGISIRNGKYTEEPIAPELK